MGLVDGPGQGRRFAPELHGRGVRQELPFPADQGAQEPHDDRGHGHDDIDERRASGSASIACAGDAGPGFGRFGLERIAHLLEDVAKGTDQGHVEGVSPDDVSQLVGGDRLELVPRAFGQHALRNGDGGRPVRFDEPHGVDGRGREDIGGDAGGSGRDADLFERVEELDVVSVGRVRGRGFEPVEDIAGAELPGVLVVEPGDEDRDQEIEDEEPAEERTGESPASDGEDPEGQQNGQGDEPDGREIEQDERGEEEETSPALAALGLVEIADGARHNGNKYTKKRGRNRAVT